MQYLEIGLLENEIIHCVVNLHGSYEMDYTVTVSIDSTAANTFTEV